MTVGGPSAPNSEDPLLGRVLSERYRIISKLGEGGMGVVYLAEHVVIEKKIALKVLFPDLTRRKDLVQRFLQEAKSASRIGHENVIDITDFGQSAEGYVFIAMEYLSGQDLGSLLKVTGPMTWTRAQPIVVQIVKALRAAHERGIVHRDMKPENIFIVQRDDGREFVKVLDFGIAKVLGLDEDAPRLTRTGMIFGTPEYMSPEQAQGQSVDHRVDIYAVGCILYHLLTGDVPFRAESFMGILSKHMVEAPEAPRLRNPSIDEHVEAVILHAMEKDPAMRFQSMGEFLRALVPLGANPEPSGAFSSVTGAPITRSSPPPVTAVGAGRTRTDPLPDGPATSLPHSTRQIPDRAPVPLAEPNPEVRRSQTEMFSRENDFSSRVRTKGGKGPLLGVAVVVVLGGVLYFALAGKGTSSTATPTTAVEASPSTTPPSIPSSTPPSTTPPAAPPPGAVAPSGTAAAHSSDEPAAAAGPQKTSATGSASPSRRRRSSRDVVDSLPQVEGGENGDSPTPKRTPPGSGIKTPDELKNPFAAPSGPASP